MLALPDFKYVKDLRDRYRLITVQMYILILFDQLFRINISIKSFANILRIFQGYNVRARKNT